MAVGNQESAVSKGAKRVLDALRSAGANCPERAMPDAKIAASAKVAARDVIDMAGELVAIDVAVLATCGKGRDGKRGKGRFICANPAWVRKYAEKLHARARAIHMRAKSFRLLADRMDARRSPDSTGQHRITTDALFDCGTARRKGAFA